MAGSRDGIRRNERMQGRQAVCWEHFEPETNMKPWPLIICMAVLAAACTTTNEIIIDQKGVNMSQYEADLADCQTYAEQVAVGKKAAKGAGSGAVVGGAIGAIDDRRDAGEGAAVGAVLGGVKGISEGERDQVRVVKNCLRGRGYRILN
jgi:hypothetical protein